MSLHCSKAIISGIIEAIQVNEWFMTMKLGNFKRTKPKHHFLDLEYKQELAAKGAEKHITPVVDVVEKMEQVVDAIADADANVDERSICSKLETFFIQINFLSQKS